MAPLSHSRSNYAGVRGVETNRITGHFAHTVPGALPLPWSTDWTTAGREPGGSTDGVAIVIDQKNAETVIAARESAGVTQRACTNVDKLTIRRAVAAMEGV